LLRCERPTGGLARFWGGLLGWEIADDTRDSIAPMPGDDNAFRFRFRPTQAEESSPYERHLHLTSTSLGDRRQTVDRSLVLGARHIDVGQRPEEGHIVLADPEGNEFWPLVWDQGLQTGTARRSAARCPP
jgi:hypothetical protein